MADGIPPLAAQEEEGQFHEEIDKIVDGVVEDILAGHVRYKSQAKEQAAAAARQSAYAVDQDLALAVLKYGAQPETQRHVAEIVRRVVWSCVFMKLADDEKYQELPP